MLSVGGVLRLTVLEYFGKIHSKTLAMESFFSKFTVVEPVGLLKKDSVACFFMMKICFQDYSFACQSDCIF